MYILKLDMNIIEINNYKLRDVLIDVNRIKQTFRNIIYNSIPRLYV